MQGARLPSLEPYPADVPTSERAVPATKLRTAAAEVSYRTALVSRC